MDRWLVACWFGKERSASEAIFGHPLTLGPATASVARRTVTARVRSGLADGYAGSPS